MTISFILAMIWVIGRRLNEGSKSVLAAKPFEFSRFPSRNDDLYQTDFAELLKISPSIIYIDFSQNRDFKNESSANDQSR